MNRGTRLSVLLVSLFTIYVIYEPTSFSVQVITTNKGVFDQAVAAKLPTEAFDETKTPTMFLIRQGYGSESKPVKILSPPVQTLP